MIPDHASEKRYRELLAQWVEESLSEVDADELLALVAADPVKRIDLGRHRLLKRALHYIHDSEEIFTAAEVRCRLSPRDSGRQFRLNAQRRIRAMRGYKREHRGMLVIAVALIVSLLTVTVAILLPDPVNPHDQLVSETIADSVLRIDSGWVVTATGETLTVGAQLSLGEGFEVPGNGEVLLSMLASGHRITLSSDSQVTVRDHGLYLSRGNGDVVSGEHSGSDTVFIVSTPHVEVRPMGTSFSVLSAGAHSDIVVHSGRVHARSSSGSETVLMSEMRMRVQSDGEFVALSEPRVQSMEVVIDDFSNITTSRSRAHDHMDIHLVPRLESMSQALRMAFHPGDLAMAQLRLKMDDILPDSALAIHVDVFIETYEDNAAFTVGVFDEHDNFWLLDELSLRNYESEQWHELKFPIDDMQGQTWRGKTSAVGQQLRPERITGVTITLKNKAATVLIDNIRWSGPSSSKSNSR